MTAKREESASASCTSHPSNDENAAAIMFHCPLSAHALALVPSVQATEGFAIQLAVGAKWQLRQLQQTTGTICGGNVSRSCACNALVPTAGPIAIPDSPPTDAHHHRGCRLVNHTGVGNGLFDIRQACITRSISPSSIRCPRIFSCRHCARGTPPRRYPASGQRLRTVHPFTRSKRIGNKAAGGQSGRPRYPCAS